ncbi:hypothetical protein RB595_007835 [Gaeumannomyces hyphopodioides]
MAKRTTKVGITGKYGTRYGASLRKQVKRMEVSQHAKYTWYVSPPNLDAPDAGWRLGREPGLPGSGSGAIGARLSWKRGHRTDQCPSRDNSTFCGKNTVKRTAVGIWHCGACKKTISGGAYVVATPAASAARSTLRRLREIADV